MKAARILIAEGEGLAGRDFQTTLVRHGYSVPAVAKSGEAALRLAEETQPDLVLISAHLPGEMPGIEVGRKIQESFHTPVIYLTGHADDLSMNKADVAYPYGYLMKPVTETDLHLAVEAALQRSAKLSTTQQQTKTLEETLQSISQGVIAADLAGNVAYLNRKGEEITGWTSAEAVGQPIGEVFKIVGKSTLRRKDGTEIKVEDNSVPLESAHGELNGVVTVFHLSDGATTEHPDQQLTMIAKSIADPLITFDAAWRITYLNPQASELYTLPREEVIGRDFWGDFPESERARYRPEFEKALQTREPHHFDFHIREQTIWFHVRLYPFAEGLLAVMRDITEEKQNEAEFKRVQRLESLGLLARGFAHDFNNVLTVLLGNLSLAQLRTGEDRDQAEELGLAMGATEQAQNLVQQLMTFAKGGAPIKGPIRPSDVLERLLQERREKFPEIAYQLVDDCPEVVVQADPKQLHRLLENVLSNAEQSMRGVGTVFIRCQTSGNELQIEVIDSGAGMAQEIVEQVFEPFFTTRGADNATGLGLTVCESIARAHNGRIEIQSKPEKGTIAIIYLPVSTEQPLLLPKRQGLPSRNSSLPQKNGNIAKDHGPLNGAARVLVLEDESLIRRLISATLTQAGYRVTGTKEGQETINVFHDAAQSGHPFDLLIMDLTIERGMGGIEAMDHIKKLDPNARAIVSSGYSDDPAMANPREYGFSAVLPKPYQPQQLVDAVNGLMGG